MIERNMEERRNTNYPSQLGLKRTEGGLVQTSPLNWKSRLMVASRLPPKETESEESVDFTSAERELDLGGREVQMQEKKKGISNLSSS